MSPRENAQLALSLAPRELEVNEEKRREVVMALADLLLTVARARSSEAEGEEDGDDL